MSKIVFTKEIFFNTVFWGFALWLFGYVLGFVFYPFIPKDMLGWVIMPFGLIAILWVLFKKIKRSTLICYIGLGAFWVVMAVILDYLFIVLLLKATDYYKLDVQLYYLFTVALPMLVGFYKFKISKSKEKLR
ncbi:MAG: hypothetical protein ACOYUZ_06605 [Patescibacteria group bacterium]